MVKEHNLADEIVSLRKGQAAPIILLREPQPKRRGISEAMRGMLALVAGPALMIVGALLIWAL
jgi:hypothetical protein